MEEKKEIKISLSTFVLLITIIIIGIMSVLIYKFYIDKVEADKKSNDLQSQVNQLNGTLVDLKDKEVEFTESQVKSAVANYLELSASASCSSLLETLNKKGELMYNYEKNTYDDDGTIITSIKFEDYQKAMLNYVTQNEFEKSWSSSIYLNKNSNGYLTTVEGGGGFRTYTIKSITKRENNTYIVSTVSSVEGEYESNDKFEFKLEFVDNKCVVAYFKEV